MFEIMVEIMAADSTHPLPLLSNQTPVALSSAPDVVITQGVP
jgi:hypothetical protein